VADKGSFYIWIARLAVGAVFAMNVFCALLFIFYPAAYAPGFELSGAAGNAMVRGMGILFLMWNATFPPVILRPAEHSMLFIIILVQQLTGLVGETCIWLTLPYDHQALHATGLRFIFFDGVGLLLMSLGYALLRRKDT
jgi:hypothetical protein